jgi:hypothetical protein
MGAPRPEDDGAPRHPDRCGNPAVSVSISESETAEFVGA